MVQKIALVVGASRGIGRQIAVGLASEGYHVVLAAKSSSDASKVEPFPPDPNSSLSTIDTVAREISESGGSATTIAVDVRDYSAIERMANGIEKVVATIDVLHSLLTKLQKSFGKLDVLVYNSGAIWWSAVDTTPMKRFQLMQRVNPEGLYGCIQVCFPLFAKNSWKARIIVVSPPIYSRFFRGKTAYAMGKVGMSVLVKGLAMDFERQERNDMAITGIWPAAAIDSAATKDPSIRTELRKPTIFSDAIIAMLNSPAATINGNLELDEDYLRREHGVTDFSHYALVPGAKPRRIMPAMLPDLSVAEQNDEGNKMDSSKKRSKL